MSQAPTRVFLHCQDRWPPGLGLDGRIPPSLLGEEDSGYSSLQRISPDTFLSQTSLTHSHLSASWFFIICFGPLFAWFLGIQRLSPNILSPSTDMAVVLSLSYLTLSTPWTVARRAPLSVGFSRQEYQSGLPFPSPEDLPNPGIEPRSPALQGGLLHCRWILYQLSYEGKTICA